MRMALAMVILLAAGCSAADPVPQPPQVNHAGDQAIIDQGAAEHAAWAAKHPRLAGIDLYELHAFGMDPYWSFNIGDHGVGVSDTLLGEDSVRRDEAIEPVVRGGRATYRGRNAAGVTSFVLTVAPGDCRAGEDRTPLTAELRIGTVVRKGCAGSPYQMRDGWD